MPNKPTSEDLVRLISEGYSDAACGQRFGLSKYAIRRLRRRWNIPARQPAKKRDDEVELAADRWGRGNVDPARIAALYGGRRYGPGLSAHCSFGQSVNTARLDGSAGLGVLEMSTN